MRRGFIITVCALWCLLLTLGNLGCAPSIPPQLYPHIPRIYVCMRPPTVEPDERHWAYQHASRITVPGNDRDRFEEFLPHADQIFIYDHSASAESVDQLPYPYNEWTCDGPGRILARASADVALPSSDAHPLRTAERIDLKTELTDTSPTNRHLVAIDAPAKSPKKPLPVFHVCVRPPGVHPQALQWAATRSADGTQYTTRQKEFDDAAATADRIFVYDQNAPPESVYEFGPPFDQLQCPGKPKPAPRDATLNAKKRKATIEGLVAKAVSNAWKREKAGLGGSSEPTWSSSETGKGPPLSFFEAVVRQALIGQAVLSGDTSGNLKDPNGARYGTPNGKDPNGPDSLFLQFTVTGFVMLGTPIKKGAELVRKIGQAARKNAVLIIADPKLLSPGIAENLVKKYGDDMAPSLHGTQTILPFARARLFTQGWRLLYQAHHILEVNMAKYVGVKNTDDIPAIILTDVEHKAITKELKAAQQRALKRWETTEMTKEILWESYQDAYARYPIWLKAIEQYF